MLDAGIATRRGIMNAHLEPAYRTEPWKCAHGRTNGCACLRESELAQQHCIILPLYHEMTDATLRRVTDLLRSCLSMEGCS